MNNRICTSTTERRSFIAKKPKADVSHLQIEIEAAESIDGLKAGLTGNFRHHLVCAGVEYKEG